MGRSPPQFIDELAPFGSYEFSMAEKLFNERGKSMKLRITREDLLRSKIVAPNWYPAEVTEVNEALSKAGDSTNWNVTIRLTSPEEVNGVTVIRTFNEKGAGFALNFLKACGANITDNGGEFDMNAAKGRKIQVYIKTEVYNGTPRNRAEDFRPL